MAKRFTDTDKWKKPFIKSLPLQYKIFWFYILDDCDFAGVWQVDKEVSQIRIGVDIDLDRAKELYGDRIVEFDGGSKWFIPDFIIFQYGSLTEKNKLYKPIYNQLSKYDLMGHLSPINGVKVQVQVKDKVKVKEEGGVGENEKWNTRPGEADMGLELPEIKSGAVIELFMFTKNLKIGHKQVEGLWKIFKMQNFTGEKRYQSENEVYSHFINWCKSQNIDQKDNRDQQQSSAPPLKKLV